MAGYCCPESALGNLVVSEDTPCKGTVETLPNGMDAYVTGGSSKTAVLVAYDIYGFCAGRSKQICDTFAAEGHLVVMPDFFRGDSVEKGLSRGEEKMSWIRAQSSPGPLLDVFDQVLMPFLASRGVERVAVVGWCWGAWFVVKTGGTGRVVAGVAPHPSYTKLSAANGEAEDAVLAAMGCPLLILPAGDDPESTKAGGANEKMLTAQGHECKVHEFPEMKHGFFSRGDITDPLVARDVQLAMATSIPFLNRYLVDVNACFLGKVVVVTGCSRGLGLGIARHLMSAGATVVATCRDPANAAELQALISGGASGGSCVLPCDVASEDSIKALVEEVGRKFDRVHMLVNNAGISSPNHPNDPILTATRDVITDVFQTNVLGTVSVTQAFLPLMRAANDPSSTNDNSSNDPSNTLCKTVINMSSQLASIANCFGCQGRMGGVASYRISRAAGNMATRTFAGELAGEGFMFISMSPGHVATDMGSAGGRKAPLTVDQSVSGMLRVIAGARREADNGKYLQYDGQVLDW